MRDKPFHIFVSLPIDLDQSVVDKVFAVINEQHPDAVAEEILDGYWSPVRERTLQIGVVSNLKHVQQTAKLIQSTFDGFVAIDEPE
jgi:hypothetical protein